MSGRTILFLILAVVIGFGVIAVRNRMNEQPQAQEVKAAKILVATRDISQGSFIESMDLEWKEMPEDITKNTAYINDSMASIDSYSGAIVRRSLRQGDPVAAAALTKTGEGGFLSAVLEPGMRAVSIAVTATSGNAGFVAPGDRVDLVVTHRARLPRGEITGIETVISDTFVINRRVVAVDQMLDNPDNKAMIAKTVTVEVTPREAEMISVAAEMGKISLVLHSLGNVDPKQVANGKKLEDMGAVRDTDISKMLEKNTSVRVIRGDKTEKIGF